MDRRAIREDIINLINEDLYNDVDIAPIIKKYTDGKQIEEQGKVRQGILSILYEMKKKWGYNFYRI